MPVFEKEPYILPENFELDKVTRKMIEEDYAKFSEEGLPKDVGDYVFRRYGLKIDGRIDGLNLKNPFGKASGQLSMNSKQVMEDIGAGIGFIVLKTVVAQNEEGISRMEDWKVKESKMIVERIRSKSGRMGWTVTWNGRGWSGTFDEYLEFYGDSLDMGDAYGIPILASCMFHLPSEDEEFEYDEFEYTVGKLCEVYLRKKRRFEMIMEVDFSPTLNLLGDVKNLGSIERWFDEIPELVKRYGIVDMKVGAKVFNVIGDEDYQKAVTEIALRSNFDFLTLFNRLFDPVRKVAYGGYDLSDRNLRVMDELRSEISRYLSSGRTISGTGNICSGRMMMEYALRGCSSGQIHTFFQIPMRFYGMKKGSRTERALNELIFNPKDGLIPSMIHLGLKNFMDAHEV